MADRPPWTPCSMDECPLAETPSNCSLSSLPRGAGVSLPQLAAPQGLGEVDDDATREFGRGAVGRAGDVKRVELDPYRRR